MSSGIQHHCCSRYTGSPGFVNVSRIRGRTLSNRWADHYQAASITNQHQILAVPPGDARSWSETASGETARISAAPCPRAQEIAGATARRPAHCLQFDGLGRASWNSSSSLASALWSVRGQDSAGRFRAPPKSPGSDTIEKAASAEAAGCRIEGAGMRNREILDNILAHVASFYVAGPRNNPRAGCILSLQRRRAG